MGFVSCHTERTDRQTPRVSCADEVVAQKASATDTVSQRSRFQNRPDPDRRSIGGGKETSSRGLFSVSLSSLLTGSLTHLSEIIISVSLFLTVLEKLFRGMNLFLRVGGVQFLIPKLCLVISLVFIYSYLSFFVP